MLSFSCFPIQRGAPRVIAIALGLATGCAHQPMPPFPPPDAPQWKDSVVINTPSLLREPFAFSRTVEQIVASAPGFPTTPEAFLQGMVDSFSRTAFKQPRTGKTIRVNRRPERRLSAAALLDPDSPDGMRPVGLFNRFDLAPADGGNCGEYRIVYAKNSANARDRMTMIFEARIPNPDGSKGLAGCQPIVDFWARRVLDPDRPSTVEALEKFYYQGIPGVPPVVDALNYGLPLGQIRVNLFKVGKDNAPWTLREFIVGMDDEGKATLTSAQVDDSPVAALFRSRFAQHAPFSRKEFRKFRNDFLGQPLCNLVNPDLTAAHPDADAVINGIAAGFHPDFNDFESISQTLDDDPANHTETRLKNRIRNRLNQLGVASTVTPRQLLNRAGAMTCGGCHEFSSGRELASNIRWPNSLGFVHIDENGAISELLSKTFIPRRIQIVQAFEKNPNASSPPRASCLVAQTRAAAVMPKVLTRTRPASGRRHPIYNEVDDIIDRFFAPKPREASSGTSRAFLLKTRSASQILRDAVKRARRAEQSTPGAFTPVRRSH